MPIPRLTNDSIFPPPDLASPAGILAVGGDLSPQRLLEAYRSGIFPWYEEGYPVIWWSPDPRCVLFPEKLRISRSMKQTLRQRVFHITYDYAFHAVMEECRKPRNGKDGTWITKDMIKAYDTLHSMGYAHSVEAWKDGILAGGLYGVSLGGCFFGESMFARVSNASKAAFIMLVRNLNCLGFTMIDCQVQTDHLISLGAEMIPRTRFISVLEYCLQKSTLRGHWGEMAEFRTAIPS
jgi:leucyl/phenylalanyl-tRNA--protein transferase